ncbi:MAG TPA: hypothetical protein VGE99_00535 [Candidatus Dormibacteraeota bacterium]
MSLRTDIQDAIDRVTPPAPGLEHQVRALLAADGRDRRVSLHARRSVWRSGFRSSGALVAAGLVVALMAGIVIGGRMARDAGNGQPSQAGSINQADLHGLESKPLLLPVLRPGEVCPYTNNHSNYLGTPVDANGPVYMLWVGNPGTSGQGDWIEAELPYTASRGGPVLIRGRDLHTNQPLLFTQFPFGPSAVIAAGPVLGTDRVDLKTMQLHPEAVLLDPWHRQPVDRNGTMPLPIVMFSMAVSTLCWGLQFDGPGFSETYVNGWDSAQEKISWRQGQLP